MADEPGLLDAMNGIVNPAHGNINADGTFIGPDGLVWPSWRGDEALLIQQEMDRQPPQQRTQDQWVPSQPSQALLDAIADPNTPTFKTEGGGLSLSPYEQPSPQQQALLGYSGEGARNQAGNALLNYIGTFDYGDAPAVPNFHPPMTGAAQAAVNRQDFPIDPNRIVYNGSNFSVDDPYGPDLFHGQLPKDLPLSQIPRSLQLLLGPAIAAWYGSTLKNIRGGAPPWSGFFAPPAPQTSTQFDHTWPGITMYDAWGRSLGEFANLYS